MIDTKEKYMRLALAEAENAFKEGEIPIGAVIVRGTEVISASFNSNRRLENPIRHAEINAIELAAGKLKNERLIGCDLYVTKEPCAMCAGAIVHARIDRVIIGSRDMKYGACGSVLDICGSGLLNHRPEIISGVLEDECTALIKLFFEKLRLR